MKEASSLGLARPFAALLVAGALLSAAMPAPAQYYETRTSISSYHRPHRPHHPPSVHYPPPRRPHHYYSGYRQPDIGAAIIGGIAAGLIIGAIVSSLPPNCSTVYVNGVAYHNCGGTYYRPRYYGGNVEYVVVEHP